MSNNQGHGGRGGRGRGRFHNRNHQARAGTDSKEAVPVLTYGPSNNWIEFKKKITIYAGEQYGVLNTIMKEGKYHAYPFPTEDSTITNSTQREKALDADIKIRQNNVNAMNVNKPHLYNFIISKMSTESESQLQRHKDFEDIHEKQDPLRLWQALETLHLVTTVSKRGVIVLQQAAEDYAKCTQGEFEDIHKFKERFEAKLKSYNTAQGTDAAGNAIKEDEKRSAFTFLCRLHRPTYASYYAHKVNQINDDETKAPKNISEVYLEAQTYVVVAVDTKRNNGLGASFATTAQDIMKQNRRNKRNPAGPGGGNGQPNPATIPTKGNDPPTPNDIPKPTTDSNGASTEDKTKNDQNGGQSGKDLSKVQCFNCLEFGHYKRNCPKPQGGLTGMTRQSLEEIDAPHWYEVGLDNCSQVNIMNSRFLSNIRQSPGGFYSVSRSGKSVSLVGDVEMLGLTNVLVCDDCACSVLSFCQIEDKFRISYDYDKKQKTVHLPDGRTIVFTRRVNMYLTDWRPYITDPYVMSLMTVEDREHLFTKQQVDSAKLAGEFIRNAGFPSEQAAINVVRSGNINNIPFEVSDIKNYFEIYGVPVPAIRGKMTLSKQSDHKDTFDIGIKEQITVQELTSDVMYAAGKKFLISLASPLQLTICLPVKTLGKKTLGSALQSHLELLRMFSFDARVVFVDPLKALLSLRGSFPGVEVQATGAGDHLSKVDIRIRRIKEMARSIISNLDWTMPKALVNELITFCVSRMNVMMSKSISGDECPRVKLTGRKIDYKKEFALTFGDYVETKNKDKNAISNSITQRRSDPCIALYPTLNVQGSWR